MLTMQLMNIVLMLSDVQLLLFHPDQGFASHIAMQAGQGRSAAAAIPPLNALPSAKALLAVNGKPAQPANALVNQLHGVKIRKVSD